MKILIIEDEEKLAGAIKRSLEFEGYSVEVYNDGLEGAEAGLMQVYDLVILDLGLPGLDGISVCKKIRAKKKQLPILIITARDSVKSKIEGLDGGADDYIVKPFDFEELLARIRALLRRSKEDNNAVLSVGDLIFDQTSKNVTRGGVEISLSQKEMGLLEYLMKNQGKVMSKSQIIESVWDNQADPLSNVVDVYIGYLRNKIEKPFNKGATLIITVKGIGYKMEAK
jgi:DNA-binding response OmpR family regulator